MNTIVQVRNKGQFTIPAAMREKLGIEEDSILSVSLLDSGAIIIIPKKLETPSILKETATLAKKHGVTLEEMLADLDEIRHNS
ncbi:MAG: AbrB/MazE/SpoVT family DNA-binding domain-containing protein [Patescibacteria group bacterium]